MGDRHLPDVRHFRLSGVTLVILGVVALAAPAIVGVAVVWIIGAALLLGGAVQFLQGLRQTSWSDRVLPVVTGAIAALSGLIVLGHPLLGLSFLTLVLVGFFWVEGVWKIVASLQFRPASGWRWMLGSGIAGLVLGLLMWEQWPLSGIWAVGVLVGLDLLATGAAMVALAVTVRRLQGLATTVNAARGKE